MQCPSQSPLSPVVPPVWEAPSGACWSLRGVVGDWLGTVTEQWLVPFPQANPALLQMFRDRDRQPPQKLNPWSGEFVGKYLLGALGIWELTADAALEATVRTVVEELLAVQDEDGYLGPFPRELRLTADNWDPWGHYHVLSALLRYGELTGDQAAEQAVRRGADLLCRTFGPGRARVDHSPEMNLAPLHLLTRLYGRTGHEEYLSLAQWLLADSDREDSVQCLRGIAEGRELYQFAKSRWELLHTFQGLAELYWLTGEERCRQALVHIWDSIRRLDRHNTGGFSTGEGAVGTPYALGAIETCCTVAWMLLSVDALRLTGDSRVADELELSLYSGMRGAMHPSGRWWTYDTPMNGLRQSSSAAISWQAHPGGPDLNCCHAHAARGLATVRDWAVMVSPAGVAINLYGPGEVTVPLAGGGEVTLAQATEYPREGLVELTVTPDQPREFELSLRIPAWSQRTEVRVAEETVEAEPGRYLTLGRVWQPGDKVILELDCCLRYWASRQVEPPAQLAPNVFWDSAQQVGEGQVSLYRGPLLLAWDRQLNRMDPDELPALDMVRLEQRVLSPRGLPGPQPLLLVEVEAADGTPLRLCDFGSAGQAGTPYRSWLPARGADLACEGPFGPPWEGGPPPAPIGDCGLST